MILADIVRRSLADPEFFYSSKRTNDVIADTARWRADMLSAESYILDDNASFAIGAYGMNDPSLFERAMSLIHLPHPIVWIEFNLKQAIIGSGGDPSKEGDTYTGVLIKREPFAGHANAMRMRFVMEKEDNQPYSSKLPRAVVMSPVTYAFDPMFPFLDKRCRVIDTTGMPIADSNDQFEKLVFATNKFNVPSNLTELDTIKNQGYMMGTALHNALTQKNADYLARYYQIARHGITVIDGLCAVNLQRVFKTHVMLEFIEKTARSMSGDFRRALAILALLSIRYTKNNTLTPVIRRNTVEPPRANGKSAFSHTTVTLNIPRTAHIDYTPYLRSTAKALNEQKRIVALHSVEAHWVHNYKRHNTGVCKPYDMHCWQANYLRVDKNSDPVPDPRRFTCQHCGLKRWYRSEHEAGSAGAQRVTKDRKLVHNKQGTQQ